MFLTLNHATPMSNVSNNHMGGGGVNITNLNIITHLLTTKSFGQSLLTLNFDIMYFCTALCIFPFCKLVFNFGSLCGLRL